MTPHQMYLPVTPAVDLAITARQGRYDAPTLLFVHGLGDSSLAWTPFLRDDRLEPFTVLAPDLPGYGETIVREGHGGGFDLHLTALRKVVDDLVGGPLLVIAHSMGGLLATLLLREMEKAGRPDRGAETMHSPVRLIGFINIEGNLTADDAFISGRALAASKGRRPFRDWFEAYTTTSTVGPWAKEHPQLAHYGESLKKCDPEAFLADCADLVDWKGREDERSGEPAAGAEYLRLRVRKCYLFGSTSVPVSTCDFLVQNKLRFHEIEGGTHWAMLDDPEMVTQLILKRLAVTHKG